MDQLSPVTLIVKAPNQKIEDRRVACDGSWTVRQLKEHLSTVYPEKPREDQQKLVYYGKLLRDESQLREVLTHDTFEDAHTVHLVCPQHATFKPANPRVSDPSQPRFFSADTITEPQNLDAPNEIRNRFGLGHPVYEAQTNSAQQLFSNSEGDISHLSITSETVHRKPVDNYPTFDQTTLTPQQKLWMQAYQQQCWLYYNHLQQVAMLGQFPQVPLPQHPGEADVAADVMRQEQAAPGNADNDAVQMNAQGGVDAAEGQRDWLDRSYTLFRFLMIMVLFYFYTTVSRFFTVCAIALFFYLARGNFRLQRRQVNPVPAPAAPPAEENQAENQNNENAERSNPETDSAAPGPATDNQPQGNPARLSYLFGRVFSIMFSFFASLVPQQPDVVVN